MRTTATTIFILLLTLSFNTIHAQGRDQIESLKGNWQFILGDDMRFADPNYDDSDWEKIRVPSSWESEGFRNYDGYAWYRKTFDIDADDASDPLFLHLGRIDDVDEVFFNGKRIGGSGKFPPNMLTAWNQSRAYAIPADLVKTKGDNVIAVRVYDDQQAGGILGWNIGIYNYGGFGENSMQLMGQWKFNISDDMTWAEKEFDDSSWEDIMVPSTWESQGYRDYDGFAWYRKRFEVPADFPTSDRILILGKIDDNDQVFVNGAKIGGTGDMKASWVDEDDWAKTRTYFIPNNLLKKGKNNVIAVRVLDAHGDGGIYEGPVTIIDSKDYKEFWREHHRNNYDFPRWFMTYFED